MTVDEGRALDIVCLSFSKASEVDWKLAEWLGREGGDQWHEV